MNEIDWGAVLVEQLDFYWNAHFRPRLEGLSDDEYLWEPVEGCWSVRQRPDGTHAMDRISPAPSPPPLTTIAWRMMHIGVECFVTRASTFFGNGTVPDDADMFDPRHVPSDLPGTAARAVSFLDEAYAWWHGGVAGLDDEDLAEPLGRKGGGLADSSMAELIAHINREVMHHGGEIGVLRDLYRVAWTAPSRGPQA